MKKTKQFNIKKIDNVEQATKKSHKLLITKIIIIFILIVMSAYGAWMFINTYEFQTPVIFQSPIIEREHAIISPLVKKAEAHELTNEEYLLEKFGKYGDIALAVAKAESGLREDAYHVNTNGSVDVGVFQINSVHFSKDGCALKDLLDFKKNVDCAYKIFEVSGFNPWVAFTTGSYISKL